MEPTHSQYNAKMSPYRPLEFTILYLRFGIILFYGGRVEFQSPDWYSECADSVSIYRDGRAPRVFTSRHGDIWARICISNLSANQKEALHIGKKLLAQYGVRMQISVEAYKFGTHTAEMWGKSHIFRTLFRRGASQSSFIRLLVSAVDSKRPTSVLGM